MSDPTNTIMGLRDLLAQSIAGENEVIKMLAPMLAEVRAKGGEPKEWVFNREIHLMLQRADRYGALLGDYRDRTSLLGLPFRLVDTAQLKPPSPNAPIENKLVVRELPLLALSFLNRFSLIGYVFHPVTADGIKGSL